MTSEEALLKLGDSSAQAALGVLRSFGGDGIDTGPASVAAPGTSPLSTIVAPAVCVSVSYVDGAAGGNVFAMTNAGARLLARAMMGEQGDAAADEKPLTEIELSAVGESMNQIMAAAAAATGSALGQAVEIGIPKTQHFATAEAAAAAFDHDSHAVSIPFSLFDEPARLVQFVPNAFVVRMTRAFSDLSADRGLDGVRTPGAGTLPQAALRDVQVRVWAEIGRFRMPLRRALGLRADSIVELDADAEEPVGVFVNGVRLATGRLLVNGSTWAVQLESVANPHLLEGGAD